MAFADHGLLEPAPLFPTSIDVSPGEATFVGGVVIGLLGGALAWLLTRAVYGAEDAFNLARVIKRFYADRELLPRPN